MRLHVALLGCASCAPAIADPLGRSRELFDPRDFRIMNVPTVTQENAMGLTFIEGTVTGPTGEQRGVSFLVDSGASYSLLPQEIWQALQLKPKRIVAFTLADGARVERAASECHIALAGQEGHTPVILGEPGDEHALLGAVTLEILGLVLDPFKRTLRAMQFHLA